MSIPIEQQVCSIELARRLKGLRVKQESVWRWYKEEGMVSPAAVLMGLYPECVIAAAFTVAELGEMLPEGIFPEDAQSLNVVKMDHGWRFFYRGLDDHRTTYGDWYRNMADAAADMLIYLIEQGIVTP